MKQEIDKVNEITFWFCMNFLGHAFNVANNDIIPKLTMNTN